MSLFKTTLSKSTLRLPRTLAAALLLSAAAGMAQADIATDLASGMTVNQIITAAMQVQDANLEQVIAELVSASPEKVSEIVTTAISLFPAQAQAIVVAATKAAPAAAGDINAAAQQAQDNQPDTAAIIPPPPPASPVTNDKPVVVSPN